MCGWLDHRQRIKHLPVSDVDFQVGSKSDVGRFVEVLFIFAGNICFTQREKHSSLMAELGDGVIPIIPAGFVML